SALINDDLPALNSPMTTTRKNASRKSLATSSSRLRSSPAESPTSASVSAISVSRRISASRSAAIGPSSVEITLASQSNQPLPAKRGQIGLNFRHFLLGLLQAVQLIGLDLRLSLDQSRQRLHDLPPQAHTVLNLFVGGFGQRFNIPSLQLEHAIGIGMFQHAPAQRQDQEPKQRERQQQHQQHNRCGRFGGGNRFPRAEQQRDQ